MTADLAETPSTGVHVQICGDAHLANFGVFATPERNLIFDVNDFDETARGPWEWDIKRLAVSIVLAAQERELADGLRAVRSAVAGYRSKMYELARLNPLDVWYDRVDVETVLSVAQAQRARDIVRDLDVNRIRDNTSLRLLPKITRQDGNTRRIVDAPPLITHDDPELLDGGALIRKYIASLSDDRQALLDQFRVVDTARKAVGVGSIGTRCYLSLLEDHDDSTPIFLQIKQADAPVAAFHFPQTDYEHQGKRIVIGQRVMQAASDEFLGWTSYNGRDYYVRQYRDMKRSVNLNRITSTGLKAYAGMCGQVLARAHARSGYATLISGYLGRSTKFDVALCAFAVSYADQVKRDYREFIAVSELDEMNYPFSQTRDREETSCSD